MKKTLIVISLLSCATTYSADYLKNLSVETAAAIKHVGIGDSVKYGGSLGVGYSFNRYVNLLARGISYNKHDSAVDEGFLGVKSILLQSSGASLYSIAGVDRNFETDNWGMSGGVGVGFKLHKNISVFAESRVMFGEEKESIVSTAGANWSF